VNGGLDGAAVAVLVVAAVLAAGDWYSRARDNAPLEYVCKPGTLTALIVVALLLDPRHHGVRAWFVVALVLSLAGDVLLMLPREQFVAGLAAFLLAHLCYVAGFVAGGLSVGSVALALVGTAVVVSPVARRVLRGVRATEPALCPPVVAYLVVIGTMLACALASGNVLAAVAAVLFVASDSMIAWDRFVARFPAAPVAIMVTYHLAQAGFVLSLLR
jgi:uncharacterized membrane protein YhhN